MVRRENLMSTMRRAGTGEVKKQDRSRNGCHELRASTIPACLSPALVTVEQVKWTPGPGPRQCQPHPVFLGKFQHLSAPQDPHQEKQQHPVESPHITIIMRAVTPSLHSVKWITTGSRVWLEDLGHALGGYSLPLAPGSWLSLSAS